MTSFEDVLRRAMGGKIGAQKLSNLTGIPKGKIDTWLQGRVQRPRDWQPILLIAQALLLARADTDTLLLAAQHPSLDELAAQLTPDHPDRCLLQPWLTTAPLPPSARHQLRAPVGDFVGRAGEIAQITAALRRAAEIGGATAISGVQGMGGIGKTELAYVVAQQLRHAFPHAQIVLALRGTSSSPLPPEQALQTVLRAFIPNAKLPEDIPMLEALYRSQLDNKHVLILADDAASAAQVQPLLPPTGCALLVTSRVRLTLPAMTTIDLEQLPTAEAIHLLRTICTRLAEDEAAALARACGYLPLALRVSGSLLRSTPAWAVADYLSQLVDQQQRLSLLRDPDEPQHDVEATLALSYAQLDAASQTVFRQLGVFAADFATALAQAVVTTPDDGNGASTLHALLRRNLVLYDAERTRWRLHDLVRAFAYRALVDAEELEGVAWRYAHAAVALAQNIQDQYLAGGDTALLALARFEAERAHIGAAQHWARQHVQTPDGDQLLLDAALATGQIGIIRYDCRHESIPQWEEAHMAAKRLGDRTKVARVLSSLGVAYGRLGELSRAIAYFEQAIAAFREQGDRRGESANLSNLGLAYGSVGELSKAIAYHEQALAIARAIGDRRSEGRALANLGISYTHLGELPKAVSYYEQRLAIARAIGDRYGEGIALNNLGNTYTKLGDTRQAIEMCKAALIITRAIGDRHEEGYTLSYLARAQALQGDMVQASGTYTQALVLLQEVGDRRGEAECQWLFGLALAQHGKLAHALPLLRAAVAYEQEIRHTRAGEHAALVARLEAGAALPPELHVPPAQRDRGRLGQANG